MIAALMLAAPLAAAAQTAGPAPAARGAFDTVVNAPGIGWSLYGANQSAKQVPATADVPGGQAVRVTVSRAAPHPYDVGATYPNTKPIASGDSVVVMVYLRAPNAAQGSTIPIQVGASEADAPYTPIADSTAQVGPSWKRFFAVGTAPKGFAPGKARIAIQLGGAKQIVELGAAFLFDPGPGFDASRLPHD